MRLQFPKTCCCWLGKSQQGSRNTWPPGCPLQTLHLAEATLERRSPRLVAASTCTHKQPLPPKKKKPQSRLRGARNLCGPRSPRASERSEAALDLSTCTSPGLWGDSLGALRTRRPGSGCTPKSPDPVLSSFFPSHACFPFLSFPFGCSSSRSLRVQQATYQVVPSFGGVPCRRRAPQACLPAPYGAGGWGESDCTPRGAAAQAWQCVCMQTGGPPPWALWRREARSRDGDPPEKTPQV